MRLVRVPEWPTATDVIDWTAAYAALQTLPGWDARLQPVATSVMTQLLDGFAARRGPVLMVARSRLTRRKK